MLKKILIILLCFPLFYLNGSPSKEINIQKKGIVSLAPNITEIIYALDAQDELIAVTNACNYPSDCKNKKVIGDPWKPNVELIISLQPKTVIASSMTDQTVLDNLKKANIDVYRINYEQNLEGAYQTVQTVGQLIEKEQKAQKIISEMKNSIDDIKSKTSAVTSKKTAVYLMSWGQFGDYAATRDTFIDSALEAAGLENIAKSASFWSISKELLISSSPNIIIIPNYAQELQGMDSLRTTHPYSLLKSDIIVVDADQIERQGVRIVNAIKQIAQQAYPELF